MTQVIVRYGLHGPEVYCPHRAAPKVWRPTSLLMGRENQRELGRHRGRTNGHTVKRFADYPDGVWCCGLCDVILGERPMVGDHCVCGAIVTTSRYREARDGGERGRHGPSGSRPGRWAYGVGGSG